MLVYLQATYPYRSTDFAAIPNPSGALLFLLDGQADPSGAERIRA